MKKISVIIPVYNAERYIEKCVDSILSQTYPVYEILLVDDGSTDRSPEICDRLAEKDPRVSVIHKKNEGVSLTRNLGLEKITGELVSFVDADDALEPNMYEFLVGLMEKYDADISHCGYKRVDENGGVTKECTGTHDIIVNNSAEAIDNMICGRHFTGGLWNKLFKRELLKDLGFEASLKNNEDVLFNALAFQNAKTIVFGDETKYLYLDNPTSACKTLPVKKMSEDEITAADVLYNNARSEEIRSVASKWLYRGRLKFYKSLVAGYFESEDKKEIRKWLIKNKEGLKNLRRQDKLNYYLAVYCPPAFRLIYAAHKKTSDVDSDLIEK